MGAEATRKEPIPAPTIDEPHPPAQTRNRRLRRRLFLGSPDHLPAHQRRHRHHRRLLRRLSRHRHLRPGLLRIHRPRRIRQRSSSTPPASPTAPSSASSSPWSTIPPSSTAKALTSAPPTAQSSSTQRPSSKKSPTAYIAQLDAAHVFPKKIVTEVTPLKAFYDGEDYHQDYAEKNPNNPYIQVCDVPKVAALKEQFPELFQDYKPK